MGTTHHGESSVALTIVFACLLVLALVVLVRPTVLWRVIRGHYGKQDVEHPDRSWVIAIRSVSGLLAVLSLGFLILFISRL